MTYLAAAQRRPNLTIRDKAQVAWVLLKNQRAVGVRLAGSGEVIEADRIVLSAGSYGSPILLMCSGIGPADLALGIVKHRSLLVSSIEATMLWLSAFT